MATTPQKQNVQNPPQHAKRRDLETLQNIKNINQQNNEIISRIQKKDEKILAHNYQINIKGTIFDNEFVDISENPIVRKVEKELKHWVPEVQFEELQDVFNDKLSYKCTSFDDIVNLNGEILRVASKWGIFDGTEAAIKALEGFLSNMKQIHSNLVQLDEKLQDYPGQLERFNALAKEINEKLRQLTSEINAKNTEEAVLINKSRTNRATESFEKFGVHTTLIDEEQWKTVCGMLEKSGDKKWVLIYRGSYDGFQANNFHKFCDNKGPTVVIIKTTTGDLFGGYTPLAWTSAQKSIQDTHTFIFTLTNPNKIPPTKYSHRAWSPQESIFDHPNFGPSFGQDPKVDAEFADIVIADNCNENNESSIHFPGSFMDNKWWGYGNLTFTPASSFTVEDIEVFELKNPVIDPEKELEKQKN